MAIEEVVGWCMCESSLITKHIIPFKDYKSFKDFHLSYVGFGSFFHFTLPKSKSY
ncbi:hypothetical protein Lalb_Chr03g0035771 [Lupinus albus]|uniref:Uncharacterized protein n=1 Tax=Lupinus albus TaxID=3870 RepID=A0A6A4QW60_LUPAL|nr:hypothetical protein Lalb_Chr03g0035771 [Lupinus albus]